jgi:hypothetical protein
MNTLAILEMKVSGYLRITPAGNKFFKPYEKWLDINEIEKLFESRLDDYPCVLRTLNQWPDGLFKIKSTIN